MDDGLKQRIIGAIVLIALLVIFIPVVLEREHIEPIDKRTLLPPVPHIQPKSIELPSENKRVERAKPSQENFVPNDKLPAKDHVEPVSLSEKGTPNSWVLQIASFLHDKHAADYRDKLITEGYDAYTREVYVKNKRMVRVYIGPKVDKARLLRDKARLEKETNSTVLLLKFQP